MPTPFSPAALYGPATPDVTPAVIAAPSRYVQGPGVLAHIGRYVLALAPTDRHCFAVLASTRGHKAQAHEVVQSLARNNLQAIAATFGGECSLPEIDSHADQLHQQKVSALIAVGGGKCVDAGKCIAYRLGVPLIIVPTLASNDAPCSAVSVLYTPQGVKCGVEAFPVSAALVVVDTAVVAAAGERFLVAGIGDAMATWYEAKVCRDNPSARTSLGARPSMTAAAMGELCADTLYQYADDALQAVRAGRTDPALEKIVEANTLLSGVGFESGGLAGAHGYASGFTALAQVEHNYLHGEMVAMGVLAQLMLQDNLPEATRVAQFFLRVGLPVSLHQLGMDAGKRADLDCVIDGVMAFKPIANLPFPVNADKAFDALIAADALGRQLIDGQSDQPYKRLHS